MFTKRSALVLFAAVVLAGCTVHVRGPSDQVAYDWSESEAYNKPFATSPQYVAALDATAALESPAPVEKAAPPAATRAKEVPVAEVLGALLPKPERATVDVDISAGGAIARPAPAPVPVAHPAPRPAPRPVPPSQSTASGGASPDHG